LTRLAVDVGSLTLTNPVMTASGTSGHGAELGAFFDLATLGAVVVKSLASFAHAGNAAPRVRPATAGMLNSVGLEGPGIRAWIRDELPRLERSGATVVVSIWGRRIEEFAEAAELLRDVSSCVAAVEVNVSCPNVEDRSKMFAHSPTATADAIAATARCGRPRWAKLSPNVADLVEIAGAALGAGAEALTLINTVLGLAIDPVRRTLALGAGRGGLSGPAIRPVALRAVYDCREAFPDTPIVGVGGVATGLDAVELLMAGANAVQVGTATFENPRAPQIVVEELREWCDREGVGDVAELISAAQRR
jgi:dihydroorotate dehydrogenase (NAD+) catalytic subunit